MKKSGTCPKCGSGSVTHADRVYSGGGFGGKEYIGLEPKAIGGMKNRFEAFTCKECGYSELYLKKE